MEKKNNKLCIIGIIAFLVCVAVMAYGVYKYLKPDYMEDFDDDDIEDNDLDLELDEDFFEDDDI